MRLWCCAQRTRMLLSQWRLRLWAAARKRRVCTASSGAIETTCSTLTRPSQGGLGDDQPTNVNPGVGFGTLGYVVATAPHSACWESGNGQYMKGDYVDTTGAFFRYIGSIHMTSDCSDTGSSFNDRADGTECSLAVGSGDRANEIRRWKTWCFAEPGVELTEYGYSGESCTGNVDAAISGHLADVVVNLPVSPNGICRRCGDGCSHRSWHCASNTITGTHYESNDCGHSTRLCTP